MMPQLTTPPLHEQLLVLGSKRQRSRAGEEFVFRRWDVNCEECGLPVVDAGSITENAAGEVVLMKCKECYEQSMKKIVLPHDCSRPAGPEPTREEVDCMDLGRQLAWHRYWNANK